MNTKQRHLTSTNPRFVARRPLWTICLIFGLSGALFATNQNRAVEQTIRNMEDHMTEAALKGDLAASEKFLSNDYVRVYPDGSVQAIDDVRNSLKFASIEVSDYQIRVIGDTAVSVFKASVIGSAHGQSIDGDYRELRTWAKERGEWKAVAFSTTRIAPSNSPALPQATEDQHRVHVKDNVFVSDDLPKLILTLDSRFQYLGRFAFDVKGIAGGWRYVWGETDHGRHLRRTFIVQVEGYYSGKHGVYGYGIPDPVTLAGDTYQHNVWIYDNDRSAQQHPGNESDLTKKFLEGHGYQWDSQLIMSRYARPVDEARKNEIIFFYFENLSDYSSKRVKDFPEGPASSEENAILASVDKGSGKAFAIAHKN
jgi:Domain of unknown function (DUF4440)